MLPPGLAAPYDLTVPRAAHHAEPEPAPMDPGSDAEEDPPGLDGVAADRFVAPVASPVLID
jgi:hypothetical protein